MKQASVYIYDFCSYKEENMEAPNYIGLHLLNINCGNKTVMCVCVWGVRQRLLG